MLLSSMLLIGAHAVSYSKFLRFFFFFWEKENFQTKMLSFPENSENSEDWKMVFTCRNVTTNEIVVMPKKSRAMMEQILFRKMFGVDGCKIIKLKATDDSKLIKLPFGWESHENPNDSSDFFVDLPANDLPPFKLENVLSPFKYIDNSEVITTTTTKSIESNTIDNKD